MKTVLKRSALVVVAILGIATLSGCSMGQSDLTREKAGELIKQKWNGNLKDARFGNVGVNSARKSTESEAGGKGYTLVDITGEQTKSLEDAGLVKVLGDNNAEKLFMGKYTNSMYVPKYYVDFTEKGRQYVTNGDKGDVWVALAEIKSVDVTGITEMGKTVRRADATIHFEPTPFGKVLYTDGKMPYDENQTNIEFSLFDDGWRVTKELRKGDL